MARTLGRSPRFWALAVLCIAVAGAVMGLPTDVLPNPWFTRMTPVRTLDQVLWPLLSVSTGLLIATYAHPAMRVAAARGSMTVPGSGLAGTFAIGCPICNKLVVLMIGTSGALTWFEPIQPVLGFGALALSSGALAMRLRASEECATCADRGARQAP